MSLAESNFAKHHLADFAVWLDSGEEHVCIITVDTNGEYLVGFFHNSLLERIRYAPDEERLAAIKTSPLFVKVTNVTLIKAGFIMSRVAFETEKNDRLLGKTDRGFANLLLKAVSHSPK